jgi:hypothetical protein
VYPLLWSRDFVAVEKFLQSRCLTTAVCSGRGVTTCICVYVGIDKQQDGSTGYDYDLYFGDTLFEFL